MIKLPVMQGLIRRRILVNFRVAPEIMQRQLPAKFRPKLHAGAAIAGICLIRREQIRPKYLPAFLGHHSENAAHRIALRWEDDQGVMREGVFMPRRDTSSRLNHLAGGRLFPGEHHHADFTVTDVGGRIDLKMQARDDAVRVEVQGCASEHQPRRGLHARGESAKPTRP